MKILVTAGATREPIDAVRFLSNVSTGATGAALADELARLGHTLALLQGTGAISPKEVSDRETFSSAEDLHRRLQRRLATGGFDAVVMAAAVADYRPDAMIEGKISSDAAERTLRLVRNEKILPKLQSFSARPLRVIGFKLTVAADADARRRAVAAQFAAGGVDAVVHNDLAEMRTATTHPFWLWRSANAAPTRLEGVPALATTLGELLKSFTVVRTLVLNVGNTSLFGGVFAGQKLVAKFRVPIRELSRRGELQRELSARVRGPIERAAFCSVVPGLTAKIARQMRRQFGVVALQLTANAPHGLEVGYRVPGELGTDRLAAALGAREIFPRKNIIVVDCGTATTVTALRRDGALLGGAIFPGLALWPQMLAARTAQLPEQKLGRPRVALGRSTATGLQSGFFHGHAGAIRELVRRIRGEAFGRAATVVVGTGGQAPPFSDEGIFNVVVPELVLVGLNYFAAAANADRL